MATLYQKLGGQSAVDAIVETFYRLVLADERVMDFVDDIDMEQQIARQKEI